MRGDWRKKIFPLILSMVLIGTMTPVYSADTQTDTEIKSESEFAEGISEETKESSEDSEGLTEEIPVEVVEEKEEESPEIYPEIIEDQMPIQEIEEEVPIEGTPTEETCEFHHEHNDKCGYMGMQEEIPCDKECSQKDENDNIIHIGECAYRPASEEHPCKYEVEVQKKLAGLEADEAILKELQEEIEAKIVEEEQRQTAEITEEQPPQDTEATEPNQEEPITPYELPAISKDEPESKADVVEADSDSTEENTDNKETAEKELVEMSDQTETELKEDKSDAMFYVSVPASVTLTGDTDSFDIETSRKGDLPDGNVLITVEGTESYDDDSFALYHESDAEVIWRYRLQIAGQILDKVHNEVLIPGTENTQKAIVVPTDSHDKIIPGFYSGSVIFHVAYQETEQH